MSKNEQLVVEQTENKIVTTEESKTNSEHAQSNQSHNVSSQTQLLKLAKLFALDGGLRPNDKQAPMEERSIKRERLNHLRKQQNMEAIIEKSLKYCSDQDISDRADPDWFSFFIELAEKVSNKTMQELWAKILAGEINQPGAYSLKALQTFKSLSIYDAKLLAKACSVAVKLAGKKNLRILTGSYQKPSLFNLLDKQRQVHLSLQSFGLGYAEITALADNGLLSLQETELQLMNKGEVWQVKYNGKSISLSAVKNDVTLRMYKFTPAGAELAQLIADKPDSEYLLAITQCIAPHFSLD